MEGSRPIGNPLPAPFGEPAPSPWAPAGGSGPSAGVRATMAQMTEQLQTIIDAAERAAEAIRLDAEEQARRHLAEAQRRADQLTAERVRLIAELTDDLIRQAGSVREHSEGMVRALEGAMRSVADGIDVPAASPGPPSLAGPPAAIGQQPAWPPPAAS